MSRRARGRSGWQKAGLATGRSLAALVSAAVISTMGYGWWAVGDIDEDTVTTDVIEQEVRDQRVPLDGAVDMLLVGIDSRTDNNGNRLPREVLDFLNAGESDGERNTDTMILVHIPVDGTRAVAISFPRDSWVELAGGFGEHRLNSAFAYAYNDAREKLADKAPDERTLDEQAKVAGRKNLIATIQNLIGDSVTIDRYAEVNLLSFYEITKAIGGVDVCLKEATRDPMSGADFTKGVQTIAGRKALAFVRQRHGLEHGDLDRIVRQQAFLGAIASKVLSADMLTSPAKVRDLVTAVQRSVVLSDGWQLSTFAAQMSGLTADGIDFYTIPTLGDANIGGADVLAIDPDQVAAFVSSLVSDAGGPDPSSGSPVPGDTTTATTTPPDDGARPTLGLVTVDVRNGSNTRGLAASVLRSLTAKGFQGGDIGDAPVRSASTIRYAPGERNLAEFTATELGGQFTFLEDGSLTANELTVVLGTNYQGGEETNGVRAQPSSTPSTPSAPPSSGSRPAPRITADDLVCVN
ncbi:LCP family protein [Actinophytocola sp. NPDC049390]|uniref:LCP family protein n=1 Tax=Actinophytocola sp. NPDC049390 TaxID=3363894 RepID=UPI0037886308